MKKYNLLKNKDNIESSEVEAKIYRRSYTAGYKAQILAQAKKCSKPGELGALLRREGLTSSTIHGWRVAQANGRLSDTKAAKRGSGPILNASQRNRLSLLEKENAALKNRLEKALALVELQKKIAELLSLQEEGSEGTK